MARFINFECGAQRGNSDSDFEDGEDDRWRPRIGRSRGAGRGRGANRIGRVVRGSRRGRSRFSFRGGQVAGVRGEERWDVDTGEGTSRGPGELSSIFNPSKNKQMKAKRNKTNNQTNKQINKQINKQTTKKQTTKQTNKHLKF